SMHSRFAIGDGMKMFGKVLMGTVAGVALLAFAPGANAATTKALSAGVHPSTHAVKVAVNGGVGHCHPLPSHGEGWVTVPGVTLNGGDRIVVSAFDSSGCTGASTKAVSALVSSYPLPNTQYVSLT
ncbi:hypothetical protein, partial [Amycolatopsis sp. NPDC059657]|uniref:hypothetical protein n=1 Tax=Amycolatopsis sp. NPDC059657 TaxID=3346899 RepID=UPI003671C0BA